MRFHRRLGAHFSFEVTLGGGGTSKGTITRLIALVIGRRNVVQLRVDQLTGRFETSRLVGKLLLNVVEATANYFNREGAEVVKALVGPDPMEAEKKYINNMFPKGY